MDRKNKILIFCVLFMFILLSFVSSGAEETNKTAGIDKFVLSDTGQTSSYTDTFGEDSNYNINIPSYRDNGNGTITDNVTGFLWQKEDDNKPKTWANAISYCDNLTLADYSNWRLPDILELVTIVKLAAYRPSIETAYFPNTKPSEYWATLVDAKYESLAWNVNFNYGQIFHFNKSSTYYVRCIRGDRAQNTTEKNYTDNGNSTITDNSTGLIWQRQSPMTGMNWESALTYCEKLSLGGYNNWRLPNYKELISLVDYKRSNPAIDTSYFINIAQSAYTGYYWASTTNVSNSFHAWIIHFSSGHVNYCNKVTNFLVRCVSSGQNQIID